jgi:organic radical activating enzyme
MLCDCMALDYKCLNVIQNKIVMNNLPIVDLHTCIQGEGKFSGVPNFLIRFRGCNLRCQFKDSCCDTPYTSWINSPINYKVEDLICLILVNPKIKNAFVTGGEPTINPSALEEVLSILKSYDVSTSIETNGTIIFKSKNLDFVSISPKLCNSIPKAGSFIYINDTSFKVTENHVKRHNLNMDNPDAIKFFIQNYPFQIKFIYSSFEDREEIFNFIKRFKIEEDKVYIMPEGTTSKQLGVKRAEIFEFCLLYGFNYSDRLQILTYENKRGT